MILFHSAFCVHAKHALTLRILQCGFCDSVVPPSTAIQPWHERIIYIYSSDNNVIISPLRLLRFTDALFPLMHRIFSSHDIVVRISLLVEDNGDLYSLARINKLVSKAALDVLWNDITLDTYLYLFRQELAPLGDAQVKVRDFW